MHEVPIVYVYHMSHELLATCVRPLLPPLVRLPGAGPSFEEAVDFFPDEEIPHFHILCTIQPPPSGGGLFCPLYIIFP